jgi:hypothetical protein
MGGVGKRRVLRDVAAFVCLLGRFGQAQGVAHRARPCPQWRAARHLRHLRHLRICIYPVSSSNVATGHCAVLLNFKLWRGNIAQRSVSGAGPDVNRRNTLQEHWFSGRG